MSRIVATDRISTFYFDWHNVFGLTNDKVHFGTRGHSPVIYRPPRDFISPYKNVICHESLEMEA